MKVSQYLDGLLWYRGDTWKIINVGRQMGDGTTYLHMVSTTTFLIPNKLYPKQIGLYVTAEDLANVQLAGVLQ